MFSMYCSIRRRTCYVNGQLQATIAGPNYLAGIDIFRLNL